MKLQKRKCGDEYHYWFYCPGCELPHKFDTRWTFNNNMELPTFNPSLQSDKCHLFLIDGMLEFCTDSQHKFAGKKVNLPELPDWLQ